MIELAEWASESNWNVQTLVEETGVSVSTLERRIKKRYGMHPKDWLARRKMAQAVKLLIEGLSVEQTALELNYSHTNTHHFSRDFKRFYGYPPSQLSRDGLTNRASGI